LDDEALDAKIYSLVDLVPNHRNLGAAGLIEVLFDLIPRFKRQDREAISGLFGQKGGSTPDFKRLGERLLRFIIVGTEQLTKIAEVNLTTIELGEPHKTTEFGPTPKIKQD
jgi:hypothetical protein